MYNTNNQQQVSGINTRLLTPDYLLYLAASEKHLIAPKNADSVESQASCLLQNRVVAASEESLCYEVRGVESEPIHRSNPHCRASLRVHYLITHCLVMMKRRTVKRSQRGKLNFVPYVGLLLLKLPSEWGSEKRSQRCESVGFLCAPVRTKYSSCLTCIYTINKPAYAHYYEVFFV